MPRNQPITSETAVLMNSSIMTAKMSVMLMLDFPILWPVSNAFSNFVAGHISLTVHRLWTYSLILIASTVTMIIQVSHKLMYS